MCLTVDQAWQDVGNRRRARCSNNAQDLPQVRHDQGDQEREAEQGQRGRDEGCAGPARTPGLSLHKGHRVGAVIFQPGAASATTPEAADKIHEGQQGQPSRVDLQREGKYRHEAVEQSCGMDDVVLGIVLQHVGVHLVTIGSIAKESGSREADESQRVRCHDDEIHTSSRGIPDLVAHREDILLASEAEDEDREGLDQRHCTGASNRGKIGSFARYRVLAARLEELPGAEEEQHQEHDRPEDDEDGACGCIPQGAQILQASQRPANSKTHRHHLPAPYPLPSEVLQRRRCQVTDYEQVRGGHAEALDGDSAVDEPSPIRRHRLCSRVERAWSMADFPRRALQQVASKGRQQTEHHEQEGA
mmetsp:Transcript_107501/g.342727  ORF Transcript_107501/g.342727 Transcript_107501/m.342727 type:complete len:360 (+) Transcript_107501:199-1278(+)